MFSCFLFPSHDRRGDRFTSEEFPSDTNEVLNWEPEESLEKWIDSVKTCKVEKQKA